MLIGEPQSLLLVEFHGDDEGALANHLDRLDEMMGDIGHPHALVRVVDPRVQAEIAEVREAGLNIMMSEKSAGKPISLHRGLRRRSRRPGGLYRAPQRRLRAQRHASHLLRARLRRLPARAPGARHEARGRREGDARDRGGVFRPRPRIQRQPQRRARRRHRPQRVQRADVRCPHRGGLRASEGRVRSRRPAQPRPHRARAALRRSHAVPLPARLSRARRDANARLVGVARPAGRPAGGGRDVQQQRHLPQIRRRRDVPVLPGDARRDAPHARARQYAAPRPHRPARAGRFGERRRRRGAEALRFLQGLQARVPDRHRHGAHEDRGPARPRRKARHRARENAWWPSCRATRPGHPGSHPLANLRNASPLLRRLGERTLGLAAERTLPAFRPDAFRNGEIDAPTGEAGEVIVFADTFNRWFEPENIRAGIRVLRRLGLRPVTPRARLCCGRTYLSSGMVDRAPRRGAPPRRGACRRDGRDRRVRALPA